MSAVDCVRRSLAHADQMNTLVPMVHLSRDNARAILRLVDAVASFKATRETGFLELARTGDDSAEYRALFDLHAKATVAMTDAYQVVTQ